ncbi:hypothetical protein J3Q64DRAFT_1814053 [Phycomyces blakesleeanus]|uniref:P-type ATPase A domain-containing protein n=2 Tax=Phycomyces blakesleeanus TaxID=4837 RepID=A0ABR3B0V3_PHYBL
MLNKKDILKYSIVLSTTLFSLTVEAEPKWNQVNAFDVNGGLCPTADYNFYSCPRLCVRDISLCPNTISPKCPSGTSYCIDGSCRTTCPGSLVSICSCPGAPAIDGLVYPCLDGLSVIIPSFDIRNKDLQSMEACSAMTGLVNVSAWEPSSTSSMWNICPNPDYGSLTFTEPAFISLYVFYSSCVVFLVLWTVYKRWQEKPFSLKGQKEFDKLDQSPSIETEEDIKNPHDTIQFETLNHYGEKNIAVKGYKKSYLGSAIFTIYIIQSFWMLGEIIMMTYDYYNGFLMFKGERLVQLSTFIGMWYIFVIWFVCLVTFKDSLSNFFRIRCEYSKAQYVQVEKTTTFMQVDDKITKFAQNIETKLKTLFDFNVSSLTCKIHTTSVGKNYFVYQYTRFIYCPKTESFLQYKLDLGKSNSELGQLDAGLTTEEAKKREEMLGPNFIGVHVPSIPMAVIREFASFFYVYQLTSLWLFYYTNYWKVAVAQTCIILVAAFVKVLFTTKSERRIKSMAEFSDEVTILRNGSWVSMTTVDLVAGDVFELKEGKTVPCDCVILSGNIMVDESSLTGEPLPIRKFPIDKHDTTVYDRVGSGKIATLFAGTTLSQVQSSHTKHIPSALVTQTGTATDKGELIKKILFPTKMLFIFDEHIKVVFFILVCCCVLSLVLALVFFTTGIEAWFYSFGTISQLISPLLPVSLVVGQSVATDRLRKKKIYCVDLPRVLMAGKVQLFCFDKTGTLTKEGLTFYGIKSVEVNMETEKPSFGEHYQETKDMSMHTQLGLATCNSVTMLNDRLVGNPVDIEMFRFSQWTMSPKSGSGNIYLETLVPPMDVPGSVSTSVHVIKRFEFVHARMFMSVAILDPQANKVHVFTKGAYEKIKELCDSESIPADYDLVTSDFAHYGCYVLALAHREIDLDAIGGLNEFLQWDRSQIEESIKLISLVLFKNQLKEDTSENIRELKHGGMRTVMITGDTALTGVYIARQCGMSNPGTRVILGDMSLSTGRVVWTDVDEPEKFGNVNVDSALLNKEHTPVDLAVTGRAFNWLDEQGTLRNYLLDIRVFARMVPNDKVRCVQMHMEHGITAMAGDGGNDCGALRAAHVGIAMSDAEASIVSPFSTSDRSVRSCVELIRQGRSALATSISGYKFLIIYGQIIMTINIISYYFSVALSQYVWMGIDLVIVIPMTWTLSQSKAATNLSDQRPTAKLFGYQTLASCIGLIALNWLFLIAALIMLYKQDWFRCHEFDSAAVDLLKWWLLSDNYEAEITSFVTMFQFVNNGAVLNFGYKYRQSLWRNYLLVFLWVGYNIILSYCLLADPNRLGCLLRLNCGTKEVLTELGYSVPSSYIEPYNIPLGHNVIPWVYRWKLWGVCMGNMMAAVVYERVVVVGPVHDWLSKRYSTRRLLLKN